MNEYGQPLFKHLQYCVRCCMPETTEGILFDESGVCQACQSSEQKIHIDWTVREKALQALLMEHKAKAGDNYDCIVPISGGKDSTFQLHVLTKVYGMKPLAVTFSHNWFSETGKRNLENSLEKFSVDHIMFTPNRALVNKLARESLGHIGDSCWHCHAGVGAFPLQIAVRFKIPLLIWGESVAESSGRASYNNPVRKFDREYFLKVSAKVTADKMICDDITSQDVNPFRLPSAEDCERIGLMGIHLGDFIFWDDERQTEFVRDEYGWEECDIEGAYKRYKSAECIMPGVHDYTKFLKRGYGRSTDQASLDVRTGLLTREEAFELAKAGDQARPGALDHYLKITGMTEDHFMKTMQQVRHARLRHLPIVKDQAAAVNVAAAAEAEK
jgi:N-acetyl sugar amidotransferase